MNNRFFKNNYEKQVISCLVIGLNAVDVFAKTNSTSAYGDTNLTKGAIAMTVLVPFAVILLAAGIYYKCFKSTYNESENDDMDRELQSFQRI